MRILKKLRFHLNLYKKVGNDENMLDLLNIKKNRSCCNKLKELQPEIPFL